MFARALLRTPRVVVNVAKRNMSGGGHGHAAPKYEGVEAQVRKYLPENYHVRFIFI